MPEESSVSVFSFTNRISSAKLKKYHDSTSRGMAASNSHAKKSHDTADSTPVTEPPTKKPRLLKLNGPRRLSDDSGDSIAVARPARKRDKNIRFKYSGDMIMTDEERNAKMPATSNLDSPSLATSPAPSSGLSSLSSAPPSEKETSPFVDPAPLPSLHDYGDFMTYYVDASEENPVPISKTKGAVKTTPKATPKETSKATSKAVAKAESKAESKTESKADSKASKSSKAASKAASKPPKGTPKPKASKAPTPASQPQVPTSVQHNQVQHPHPPPGTLPQQGQDPPPLQHHAPPQQHPLQGSAQTQHGSPAHGPGLSHSRPSMQGPPHERAAPVPQPIVQFSEIIHDPPPDSPDTVAIMIKKLHALSLALTTFGGVPPVSDSSPSPPATPKKVDEDASNPLDNFLSFFDGDGDGDGDDNVNELDRVLKNPGTLDGPLTHGIIFIQNALKSWAQQRVSQMYTTQYHQQTNQQQQSSAAKRGPGRPRKFDEPTHLLPPCPVIHMELASTPEGMAIKAFQAVLYSECLRVNVRLPAPLACALRQLYMQIDQLINQGDREPQADWQCMSYGAQILAHRVRVERWKAHQEKVQEETQRQQSIAHQTMMAQMGLPTQRHPMSAAQAEHAHAIELETRRAQAHAHQQPYIRQQHLNPLQLGPRPPGPPVPPSAFLPSQPSNNSLRSSSTGPPSGKADSTVPMPPQHGMPVQPASSSPGVQLDKMKLYVPGYLPLSGQSMKWSFAPQHNAPLQTLGSNAFPSAQGPIPNRMPMSAPPTHASSQPPLDLTSASPAAVRAATAPIEPDAMVIDNAASSRRTEAQQPVVQSLTPVDSTKPNPNGNFRAHQSPQTPVVATHGFTAVNALAPRTSSFVNGSPTDTSPETIKVASKKATGSVVLSSSLRGSKKRSASEMSVQMEDKTMPSKSSQSRAIVLDE